MLVDFEGFFLIFFTSHCNPSPIGTCYQNEVGKQFRIQVKM